MRRKIQTILKGLLGAAFMACTVLSCDNEKPEFDVPDVPVIDPIPVDEEISINIASNPISAFESGGEATVILRTTPWDILQADTSALLTLTDTLGGQIGNISLQSKELLPDSTWAIKVKVTDDAGSSFIAFALALKDTTLQTSAVELKKVLSNEFKIRSIKATDALQALDFSSSTNQYTYDMPLTVINDCSAIKLRFYYDGDKITVGDSTILKSVTPYILDLTKPLNITLWKYDLRKDYTVVAKMTGTGLPIVRITASAPYKESVASMRRDTWVPDITMRIELPDGTVDYEGTISLKGHGNQTWSDFDKKPFAIKLDSKAKILGMHKQKRWILLANVKDRTLLRNDISFWISRQTEMAYTINGEFVELVWNGQHLGNYYLCEQARIDNNRIDIHDPNLEDPEKGGIFMKIDAFLGYSDPKWADKETPFGFRSSRYNLPYVFKDPDEDANGDPLTESSPVYKYMYDYVTKMETAISKASATNHDWMNYLDLSSAVDYALIQEITMNHDAYNNWPGQGGPKSHNLYKDSCGVICFGPMWDYDYHTYTLYNDYEYSNQSWSSAENPRLKQWEILSMTNKNGKFYYSDLRKDPQFKALLLQRWNEYKVKWADGFNDYVDQMAEKIRVSESLNKAIWGYPSKQNGDWNLTFDKAVQAIKTAFQKRMEWIDNNIGNL
jgi:CotH protein.